MARVKSLCEDPSTRSLELQLNMAIQCLKDGLDDLDDDSEEYRKIGFIVEQLKLVVRKKYGRQYSPQLTILSYMIATIATILCI